MIFKYLESNFVAYFLFFICYALTCFKTLKDFEILKIPYFFPIVSTEFHRLYKALNLSVVSLLPTNSLVIQTPILCKGDSTDVCSGCTNF